MMEIKKEIVIDQSIEQVWGILGNQFTDAYKWARGLDHSEGHGTPTFEGASCSNRTCEVPGFGTIQEVIRKFDTKNYVLAYEVSEGFPDFISSAINTWSLSRVDGKTKVNMHLKMETNGFKGTIMGPMMKLQLSKLISGVVQDLKIYAETGKPSQQKEKELAKYLKKAA